MRLVGIGEDLSRCEGTEHGEHFVGRAFERAPSDMTTGMADRAPVALEPLLPTLTIPMPNCWRFAGS